MGIPNLGNEHLYNINVKNKEEEWDFDIGPICKLTH